jgi:hypothetical protein
LVVQHLSRGKRCPAPESRSRQNRTTVHRTIVFSVVTLAEWAARAERDPRHFVPGDAVYRFSEASSTIQRTRSSNAMPA